MSLLFISVIPIATHEEMLEKVKTMKLKKPTFMPPKLPPVPDPDKSSEPHDEPNENSRNRRSTRVSKEKASSSQSKAPTSKGGSEVISQKMVSY